MNIYLHTLFEQQVKLYPNATALKFLHDQATYQDLNNKSNQLANYLSNKMNVRPGDKVALYIERSIDMMVGILGILKSGGTYVPINSKIPKDRFNFLIEDVGNPIIITNTNKIDFWDDYNVVFIEDVLKEPKEYPIINFDINSPAIILYTSGSTGYPKGVLLSHKSLVNRIVWDREKYKHSKNDIILQHASYNFDFSILEIFMALANGGKLILARPDFPYESFYLIDLIQKEQITKMGMCPSLLKAYIHLPAFENCTSLKQVFLGGETLHYNLQNLFFQKSSAELINIYGPTETSISVLNWTCIRNDKSNIVPIGFPAANMKIYLFNENEEPIADGEIGEIYISGVGVALGYLNRPELTKDRFHKNLFVEDNEYMYRTGDLGRKLPSGAYQFIGRKDNQVKIHGLRIELEEIEYYLNLNENIASSVVLKTEVNKSDKLVAYVIPVSGRKIDIYDLKTYLSKKLPEYMIPVFFIQMEKFELTPNGKVDRKSLPYPDKLRILSNKIYTPAENEIQKCLIDIWEKVLEISPIGINDSFCDIGGDSLALLEIHNCIEEELDSELPMTSLSNSMTIKDLAKMIKNKSLINEPLNFIQLYKKGVNKLIIYINPVIGNINTANYSFLDNLNGNYSIIVTVPLNINNSSLPETIEEFSRLYIKSIEEQFSFKECIIGGYSTGGLVALEMASIFKNKGKSVQLLFLLDTYNPKIFNNKYLKKTLFYFKKLIKSNFKVKKTIVLHLMNFYWGNIKKIINKIIHSFDKKDHRKNIEDLSKSKNEIRFNKMESLSIKFIPKPYEDKTILISAKNERDSSFYSEQLINNNYWRDKIFKKLSLYEIPATHFSIIENSNKILIANIINDHILQ